MGNNDAFTAFESAVVAVYSRGALDKNLLKDLAEPYRDCDIDSGGMVGTLSKPVVGPDGVERRLDVIDIVIQTWTGKAPEDRPKFKGKYEDWTPELEDYQELRWTAFHKITDEFGW
jgi:hypothetical protein